MVNCLTLLSASSSWRSWNAG